ncbi:MAG: signal peptidase II [Lachnospiraceae bacterium]|nr:signal peptidase II [Lachnospiraceae bacterium]
MKLTSNKILLPLYLVAVAVLAALDQWVKHLCVLHLKGQEPIVLIPGVLEFSYLENHGAAFGMLQNKQWFFWILTVVFICCALYFFVKVPKTRYYLPMILTVILLLAGAVGNFIDRLTYRYVVDFIYFRLINFPVFNIADIYVTLSMIALVALVLFRYKDGDFAFLEGKKKQEQKG